MGFLIPMKYSIWSRILALTIAFSRMYVGVHYPTDILGGIMVGLIYGFVGYKIGSFAFDLFKHRLNASKSC